MLTEYYRTWAAGRGNVLQERKVSVEQQPIAGEL